MIKIKIYRNKERQIYGFQLNGHADYDEKGYDIVCAAISVLTLNTVNAIEQLVQADCTLEADEKKGGYLSVEYHQLKESKIDRDTTLLLEAMFLGLSDLAKQYSDYIKLYEEV